MSLGGARSPIDAARDLALRVLSFHPRTESQLRRRLRAAGHAAEVEEVVAWLLQLGYLDDPAWARATARSLLRPGRLGPRGVERRLCAAGIGADQARQAVAEALGDERPGAGAEPAEVALCRTLAERRAGGALDGLGDPERARLARFLIGRGFAGAAVARVVGLEEDPELDPGPP